MREIKFRAWDSKSKSWLKINNGFAINFNGELVCPSYDKQLLLASKQFIITQFTGLFDKNNVEIYEGDIVSSNNCINMQVMWGNVECGWITNSHRGLGTYSEASEIKVIGNIYENGVLLK